MTPSNKEDLRLAVLEYLYAREAGAHTLRMIRRRVAAELDFAFTDDELLAALVFQHEAGNVHFYYDPDGATKWWSISRNGVLRIERGSPVAPPPL